MRTIVCGMLAGVVVWVIGCSEVVRPVEQAANPTVDLIGDVSEANVNSTQISDILGTTADLPGDAQVSTEIDTSLRVLDADPTENSTRYSDTGEADINGNQGPANDGPLRTSRRDADSRR